MARADLASATIRPMPAAGEDLSIDLAVLIALGLAPLGAAVGSVVRDGVVRWFRARSGRAGLGLLAVNLAACAVVGACAGLPSAWSGLLAAGFAGGLSTWSGLAVEVAGHLRARRYREVLLHVPGAFACALAVLLAAQALGGRP